MKDENGMPEKIETPESRLKSDLISLRTQFAVLVKESLLYWCDEEIHSVVREHAEKAKALGESGLHRMKADYEKFVRRIPEELDRVFAKKKSWLPSRKSVELFEIIEIEPEDAFTVEQLAEQLSDSIRDIQGQLGTLLAKYRFVSSRDSRWGVDADDRTGQLRFKAKFAFTGEMNTILAKYIDLYNRVGAQLKLETEKKQDVLEGEAEDSWDRA